MAVACRAPDGADSAARAGAIAVRPCRRPPTVRASGRGWTPVARRHADREPRRPDRSRARDPATVDDPRSRRHAAHRPAPAARSASQRPILSRSSRGTSASAPTELLARLREGTDVALVTDAGMPGDLRPGFRLVRACADAGHRGARRPGTLGRHSPRSSLSGLPTDRFAFEGFLPRRAAASGASGWRRWRTIPGPSSSSSRRGGSRRCCADVLSRARRPADGARARAHEAARGGASAARVAEVLARLDRTPTARARSSSSSRARRAADDEADLDGVRRRGAGARGVGGMRKREAAHDRGAAHGAPARTSSTRPLGPARPALTEAAPRKRPRLPWPTMGRDVFYITTPIYYPNDVPHIGHAYNAVAADFIARYHRLRGEDVLHLTGTDEHGLKLQRAAEAAGLRPAGLGGRHGAAVARGLGAPATSPTTTTSGPREPRHERAVAKLLQAVHDNGRDDIYLGTYEGLYCVSCEALLHGGRPRGRAVPDPRPARRARRGGELLLPALGVRGPAPRALRADPVAVEPETRRNEVLSLIRGGLQDFSISRTSFTWGDPAPLGPGPRLLRLVRRAHQLHHRRRLRRRPGAVRRGSGRPTST